MDAMPPAMVDVDTRPSTSAPVNSNAAASWGGGVFKWGFSAILRFFGNGMDSGACRVAPALFLRWSGRRWIPTAATVLHAPRPALLHRGVCAPPASPVTGLEAPNPQGAPNPPALLAAASASWRQRLCQTRLRPGFVVSQDQGYAATELQVKGCAGRVWGLTSRDTTAGGQGLRIVLMFACLLTSDEANSDCPKHRLAFSSQNTTHIVRSCCPAERKGRHASTYYQPQQLRQLSSHLCRRDYARMACFMNVASRPGRRSSACDKLLTFHGCKLYTQITTDCYLGTQEVLCRPPFLRRIKLNTQSLA